MEKEKAFDPTDIRLLGAQRIVLDPHDLQHLIQEPRLGIGDGPRSKTILFPFCLFPLHIRHRFNYVLDASQVIKHIQLVICK
jgi:hypothetical protein